MIVKRKRRNTCHNSIRIILRFPPHAQRFRRSTRRIGGAVIKGVRDAGEFGRFRPRRPRHPGTLTGAAPYPRLLDARGGGNDEGQRRRSRHQRRPTAAPGREAERSVRRRLRGTFRRRLMSGCANGASDNFHVSTVIYVYLFLYCVRYRTEIVACF